MKNYELQILNSKFVIHNHYFAIPGCLTDSVTLLGPAFITATKTIGYTYDPLNRLTDAYYSTGEYFHYTYDNTGNRLTEAKKITPSSTEQDTAYTYNTTNQIASAGGKAYSYDANPRNR